MNAVETARASHVVLATSMPMHPDLPRAQARQSGVVCTERTMFADLELSPSGRWVLEVHNGLGWSVFPLSAEDGLAEAEAELVRRGFLARGDWARWEVGREVYVRGRWGSRSRTDRVVSVRHRLIVEWCPE